MGRSARRRQEGGGPATSPAAKAEPVSRSLVFLALLAAAAFVVAGILVWRAADPGRQPVADPGPVHVHGLGVNPADGALFIATHLGLYRVAPDERKATRIADRLQDTMAFTVVGPNHFLGSGHPDLREAHENDLPPHLGLIESDDAGESWKPVSLLGEADFHVLRLTGRRLYGYDSSRDRLLRSDDRGRSWIKVKRPGPLVDLAAAPRQPGRIVAVSAEGRAHGLFESRDGGKAWTRLGDRVGLLAWPTTDRLYLAAGNGQLLVSADGGRRFRPRGAVGGEPAALLATGADELYAALHDGTIKRSTDGGATWAVRSTP